MNKLLASFFRAPHFADDETTRRARLLTMYIHLIIGGLVAVSIAIVVGGFEPMALALGVVLSTIIVLLGVQAMVRSGMVALAGWLMVASGSLAITATTIIRGSILNVGTAGFVLVVVMAGLVLDRRGMLITALANSAMLTAVYALEIGGHLPTPSSRAVFSDLITALVLMVAAGFNVSWALQLVSGALTQANSELAVRQTAEAKLQSVNAELETVNRTLKSEVVQREKAEEQFRQSQKMEAIGRLAGGVAHDFNNLLTAIVGYTDLLSQRAALDDSVRHDLEQIRKAASQATSLTAQLLAFSRKQVLQPRVISPNAVVHDMQKMLARLLGEDIELQAVLSPDAGNVRTDPGQFQQVIMNLAVNARDAMSSGGRLTIETRNIALDDTYAQDHVEVKPGSYVMLAVSDTGTGMTKEVLSHLFEPFFTTKEHGKGTGLGLAMVHGIIKQSGGSVGVYSEMGKGTTFKVYLPYVDAPGEALPLASATAGAASRRGSETVLLVEDEELIMRLAERILLRTGYRVLKARQADEALALCAEHHGAIDILVTDVIMPGGMSGRDLARALSERYGAIKVLYVSGYTDNAIVHHGLLDHGVNFLAKPFSVESLTARVREVLDGGGTAV